MYLWFDSRQNQGLFLFSKSFHPSNFLSVGTGANFAGVKAGLIWKHCLQLQLIYRPVIGLVNNRKGYARKRLCRTSVRCVFRRRFEDSTSKIQARHVSASSAYLMEAMCEGVDSDTSAPGDGQTASVFEGDNGWLIEFHKIWELLGQLTIRF